MDPSPKMRTRMMRPLAQLQKIRPARMAQKARAKPLLRLRHLYVFCFTVVPFTVLSFLFFFWQTVSSVSTEWSKCLKLGSGSATGAEVRSVETLELSHTLRPTKWSKGGLMLGN